MKLLGNLLMALLGGVIAIFIYRFTERDAPEAGTRDLNALGHRAVFNADAADSINNVFNVGFGEAAETTLREVVHIRSKIVADVPRDPFFDFFGDRFWGPQYRDQRQQQVMEASGSGVIISSDGHIVTNNHVVDRASEVIVSLYNGRGYKAKIIGTDPSTDLAVLKIDEKNLPPITLANSDDVRVGDWVLAVGNPFNLASTVTAGIVSAKARNINILNDNSAIESFIQTDAAVNPGNSGGALVNLKGELVGINTAIATPTGTFAGYAFAVPSNIVAKVTRDLIDYGEVQRGYLGVVIRDLDWQLAQQLGMNLSQGVVIANLVRNGPADRAGLRVKDVILEVDGSPVESVSRLLGIIASHKPGDKLQVTIQRGTAKRTLTVQLQEAKKMK